MNETIKTIVEAFTNRGNEHYGEDVTQLEHALQCGSLAIAEQASDQMVAAALLHDIGHILGNASEPTDWNQSFDDQHEEIGYQFLVDHFGMDVAEPVRLHVAAKRYLCTCQPKYLAELSAASLKSFHDQGGLMSESEVKEFEASPYFNDSLILRKWDDQAKSSESATLELEDFETHLQTSLAMANTP